jgi:hypothetical protein
MSTRSAVAGAAATTVLFAALGKPGMVDAAQDSDVPALGRTLTGFADWDTTRESGEVVGGTALRIGATVVIVGLLCALAGRAHSRGAAFLGGWGATAVAAGAAGALFHVYEVAVINDGETFGAGFVDVLAEHVNRGAAFGVWTGWVVGLAVAAVVRTAHAPAAAGAGRGAAAAVPAELASGSPVNAGSPHPSAGAPVAGAPVPATAAGPHVSEPPAPWWAPTWGADSGSGVRPGPTAFPPGGFPVSSAPPVAPEGPPPPVLMSPSVAPAPDSGSAPGGHTDPSADPDLPAMSPGPHPSELDDTQAAASPLEAHPAAPGMTDNDLARGTDT